MYVVPIVLNSRLVASERTFEDDEAELIAVKIPKHSPIGLEQNLLKKKPASVVNSA